VNVQNVVNVHANLRGKVEIRRSGKLIGTVVLSPGVPPPLILPTCSGGCTRRMLASWAPTGARGSITLTAIIDRPSARLSRPASLSPTGPGAPAAALEIISTDDAGTVSARLTNTGRVALARVAVSFVARQDGKDRARAAFAQTDLAPGRSSEVEWVSGLGPGVYEVIARVAAGGVVLAEARAPLEVAGPPPRSTSRLWLVILAALLLIAVVGWLLFAWRRRRRAEEIDERARTLTRTGAP
jgi:hypothetical protein